MSTKKFHEIFAAEVAAISARRKKNGRPPIKLEKEDQERDGTPIMRPTPDSNVVGLAQSGGGIRSSAFCLGAVQALDARGLIDKIDYLSTVSGGGYTGTSMTAAMSANPKGTFPFTSELRDGEVPGVQHIRDHSNYLFPQGLLNLSGNIVVYLRGLIANVVLLLPWLLLLAAITIFSNPTVDDLTKTDIVGYAVHLPIQLRHLGLTVNALLAFVILMAGWALWRSTPRGRNLSDVGIGVRFFGCLAIALLVVAFLELQPWLLAEMFALWRVPTRTGGMFATAMASLKTLAAFFAPVGAVIGFLGRFLADTLKRTSEKPGFTAGAVRIGVKVAMYVAAAAVPIVLWVVYLYLSFWGISACPPPGQCLVHTPPWLTTLAGWMPFGPKSIVCLYLFVGAALLLLSWYLSPNANSLHRLYRDRLSKAFLFDPTQRVMAGTLWHPREAVGKESDIAFRGSDLKALDTLKVSELNPALAPYHLINTALNIEASKYANRRGRNAEFFIFSPLFTGSEATGYVETTRMEQKMTGLTAGTAMAVSGAAASSNMGSATVKPLVPTLAILNVRLGYWIANPAKVAGLLKKSLLARFLDKLYFAKELFGLLREDSEIIYLTDGGHIENLGIYELLRRRCKLIIAIDGEADPDMGFGSLVTLQRYARIDFSLRIDLPWATLRDVSREAAKQVRETGGLPPNKAARGPHCALGTIYYPRKDGNPDLNDSTGVLFYIKSSFTGDENDYVVDYKRRNPDFPHESTLDQLFTEEQFEVYRALGFHAVNSAFKPYDNVAMNPDPAPWKGKATDIPLEKRLRQILGMEVA